MIFINDSLNMFRLRIEDLAEVKYQKFGVIEVSDLYGDLSRSRNILLLKQLLFMNSELSNTPILIPYNFFLLYLETSFSPLFHFIERYVFIFIGLLIRY